ncbi:MAG: S-layer homology domain-containing protein [Peptoniphilus rhinitidis]|uniref:S-layer homology domain-containing protein n=1 Tax=Peptoniphilus rhinitidis TaxID=1175452 RepID=UPI0029045EB4|nr:S-layer homology domain-containing protein [Peptoniphilus rhinitidis]MDU2109399.1 S-layer homology domain-containing protein [Peptoniphilus lacydonensis]MDU3750884.1 S-layer homology domain-containing protein [Peptoniphilus rhinitidis]
MNKKNNKKKIATLALATTMLAQTVVPVATFAHEGVPTGNSTISNAGDEAEKQSLDFSKLDKYLNEYGSSNDVDPFTSNYPEYSFKMFKGLSFKETGKNADVAPPRDVTQEDIDSLYQEILSARRNEIIIPALEKNYPDEELLVEGRGVSDDDLENYVNKADAFFAGKGINPRDIVDGKIKPEEPSNPETPIDPEEPSNPETPVDPEEPTEPTEEEKNHAIGDEFINLIKDEESSQKFLEELSAKQKEFSDLLKEYKENQDSEEEKELTLTVDDMTFEKGTKEKIKYTNPEEANLTFDIYENQDGAIALEGDTVEALKAGDAKIIVKANKEGFKEKKLIANVIVKEEKKHFSITVHNLELKVGEEKEIKIDNPQNATLAYELFNKGNDVISLEGNKVKGLKKGTQQVKVIATLKDDEGTTTMEALATVTVTDKEENEEKDLETIKKDLIKELKALENLSDTRKKTFEDAINDAKDKDKAKEQLDLAKKEDDFKKKEIDKVNDIKNLSDEKKKELIEDIKKAETDKEVKKLVEEAKDLNEKAEDISLTTKVVYDKKDKEKATLQIETIKPTDKKKVTVKFTSEDKDVKLDYEKEVDKDGKASIEVKRLDKDYRINVKVIVKEEGKDTLTKNKSVKIQKKDASVLEFDVKDIKLTKKSDDRYELTFTVKDAPKDMKIEVNGNNVKYNIDKDGNAKVVYDLRDLKNDTKLKLKITADGYKEYTYEKEVKDIKEVKSFNKYVVGYPDGTFGPEKNITRAEAVAMFTRLVRGKVETTSRTTRYSDANNQWYSDALNYATEKGYISGYANGKFDPNANMTREEFAQMISKYVSENVKKAEDNTLISFKDVSDKNWSKSAIQDALERGIIKGYEDGTFKGDRDITRAEAVRMLNRTFDRKTTEKSITKDINAKKLNMFKDVSPKHWAFYEILDASNNHKANVTDSNRTWSK